MARYRTVPWTRLRSEVERASSASRNGPEAIPMPSPFPGMDPYLEDPEVWRGLHNRLITFGAALIEEALPPGFIADIEQRLYVVEPRRNLYPDTVVLRKQPEEPRSGGRGGSAVLASPEDPSREVTVYPDEIREGYIEIRAGERWERIVAVVEFLSPTNKEAGHPGREKYLQKQEELLRSEVHLLEIDLLRTGAHTVAAPLQALPERMEWEYLACLHDSRQRHTSRYWTIPLQQRLPRVRVPLTADVPPVVLDLQQTLDRAYDAGPYARRIDYRVEPPVPLCPEDAAWADALLHEKGLRA
jgi:hypothetical protein